MKKIISAFLVNSFLLQILITSFGCKSFYLPDDDNELRDHINSNKRLLIKLKDNSEFDLDPGTYLYIDKPSEFIYGIGYKYDFTTKNESKFAGIILKDNLDSVESFQYGLNSFYKYWLKDSTRLVFEKGKIYSATPDSGREYWIVLDSKKDELRKISTSELAEVQVRKIDWFLTTYCLTIGFVLVLLMIAEINHFGFSLGGGSF